MSGSDNSNITGPDSPGTSGVDHLMQELSSHAERRNRGGRWYHEAQLSTTSSAMAPPTPAFFKHPPSCPVALGILFLITYMNFCYNAVEIHK